MKRKINLSYIISTRNRLPFLKITLSKLIDKQLADEEIVVVDANSDDGTKEYLHELFKSGKIQQFISEPDKNQAHGWNKAMLMVKGTIIKKIIDDDVFDIITIRKCAKFMLENQQVDVVISNDLTCNIEDYKVINKCTRLKEYLSWRNGEKKSFTFGDVHMLIRKSALSYIGLYHTSFIMMDWEYSLRISYSKANIVYYTGYNALSVFHKATVSGRIDKKKILRQGKNVSKFYEYAGDHSEISIWSYIKIMLGKIFLKNNTFQNNQISTSLNDVYEYLQRHLEDTNQNKEAKWLTMKPSNEKAN